MDTFFNLSKIFWALANPGNFIVLLLVVSMLFSWKKITFLTVLSLIVLTVYPVGNLLLQPLENRFSQPGKIPDNIAGVIVLGGGENAELSSIWGQPQFSEGADRVMTLPGMLKRFPDKPIIFTGGSSSVLKPEYRGADTVKAWLEEFSLSENIIYERQSRNTYENALYSGQVLPQASSIDQGDGWLLVTSAFHMPRSVGIYRQQGWKVIPYPVDYYSQPFEFDSVRFDLADNLGNLGTAVREWIGLLAYYATGKTEEWFPAEDVMSGQTQALSI
ncbi:YdcF family protein [Aliamphritea hakodatensis]|uniref:YdcF family protein n=1 Tax=Aliamphritea hakodatensis TaxID=2895352 RepID=UPI0022FD9048|nr:YdcF family protein [Aliamphritea hakodatensis]